MIRTGTTGLTTSLNYYQNLSKDLTESLEEMATSLIPVQNQLDSPAVVVLQNRRGLDLLAAENRGPCLFLEDVRCFYTSKSGVVKKESESCSVVSHALQPDYSVHGILQARMLEWVAFPFSRGSSQPRDRTQASCIAGGFCTS